jgi:hypothetical protein
VECSACRRELPALLAGQVPDGVAEPLLSHLESCAACAQVAELSDAFRRTLEARRARGLFVEGRPAPDPPLESAHSPLVRPPPPASDADGGARVDERPTTASAPSRRAPARRRPRWTLVAAALVAGSLLGFGARALLAPGRPERVLNPVQVDGELFFLEDELPRRLGSDRASNVLLPQLREPGWSTALSQRPCLRDARGRTWQLLSSGSDTAVLRDPGNAGRAVSVMGVAYPDLGVFVAARATATAPRPAASDR